MGGVENQGGFHTHTSENVLFPIYWLILLSQFVNIYAQWQLGSDLYMLLFSQLLCYAHAVTV